MCFGPSLVSLLPELPPGDWNDALITKGADHRPHVTVKQTQLPEVQNTWHDTYVDYLKLSIRRKIRTGIYEVECSSFDRAVVAKFARFPWEIRYIQNETTAYQWISGHGIGPQFLGHLTEEGRAIGFLMEYITDARHAVVQDVEACRKVLSRLHGLGVRHGDTNRFNFLIRDSKAILIDFDTAQKCDDPARLLQEMEDVSACLEDLNARGGGGLL
ncbi:alpha-galactosidase A precursor [Aspergillus heteromorphus CBS 117.55]|uniref:Alpha-galactosidase A n=1 Tax=Aspergillus heteromorphus CBS 117.55 TaxID=1448321 RepID=A0A317V6R5_9EURO|nr:alpha-galactosidase A precursor [Aspergillus heteromorphus CBS 117.55]PWY68647.1 alpha-galactosidase A precursor [Aspergillus heteromorphus CBS 117.55]